jgi:hypothetical protein
MDRGAHHDSEPLVSSAGSLQAAPIDGDERERRSKHCRKIVAVATVLGIIGLVIGLTIGFAGNKNNDSSSTGPGGPIVINTWWPDASMAAYNMLTNGSAAIDAIEIGCECCNLAALLVR